MNSSPEFTLVEHPLIEQLKGQGWSHIEGSEHDASVTERESFREVLLRDRLREALTRINQGPEGKPWLDDARLNEAISALERFETTGLVEANQRVTHLLLEGVTVAGLPDWDQGRAKRVQLIDWERPERNDLLAVSQFRVDEPGSQGKRWITPDVVLFVNGIPLVVIECKSPDRTDPMAKAIKQLQRYTNQRNPDWQEGNERLFWANQLLVATSGGEARAATFTAQPDHFMRWNDPAPLSKKDLAEQLGKSEAELTGQELLVAGMLAPARLLDIVRHFTLFVRTGNRTIKIAARYQQYRAVLRTLERLRTGKTLQQDGEMDRRGGVIWHTQGSGKSLTMVFLVRAMRSDPQLRRFKVVAVTDRRDLEDQLTEVAALSNEALERAKKAKQLRQLLSASGPGMVFAMIQKQRDTDKARAPEQPLLDDEEHAGEDFGVLNDSEQIVILVDEAHRSQSSTLHARLMKALPNAAKIGFTGTPIMRADKKSTESIFGSFIDEYTIRQSEADGTTVPILYEGRTAKGAVQGASDLDELFEDMLVEHTDEQLEALKRRYATTGSVLEAPALIEAKARSMLLHYVSTVMPGGFKAQVAATSRLAAVRYREALLSARDRLVQEIEALPEQLLRDIDADSDAVEGLDRRSQILVRAHGQIELLRELDFVPIISEEHNDPKPWAQWTAKSAQKKAIAEFKKPLGHASKQASPVAFLIVKSMLLTGFDAPGEQVLYLDRPMQDVELLQAIARVNRTAPAKEHGLLVDYYGVAAHLSKALAAYAPEDAQDTIQALHSIAEELPKLRDRHARVVAIFTAAGIESFDGEEDVEACVQMLADPSLRARFEAVLRQFLTTLEIVLPRPEGLPYARDAKRFGLIQLRARRRYRDDGLEDFDPSLFEGKVRKLIDEHIVALDVVASIPPTSITHPEFLTRIQILGSERAKASEMEHALRFHIRKNFDEDPIRYAKLSERLDAILDELKDRWDPLVLALEELTAQTAEEDTAEQSHADRLQDRFRRLLESEYARTSEARGEPPLSGNDVLAAIQPYAHRVNFWHNTQAQEDLRRDLVKLLYDRGMFDVSDASMVSGKLMELARANQRLFEEGGP